MPREGTRNGNGCAIFIGIIAIIALIGPAIYFFPSMFGLSNNKPKYAWDTCGQRDVSFFGKKLAKFQNKTDQEDGKEALVAWGENAAEDKYPWMGRLILRNQIEGKEYGCGSSLLNGRFLLTAAH